MSAGALRTHYQSLGAGAVRGVPSRVSERLRAALGEERPFFYTYKRVAGGSF